LHSASNTVSHEGADLALDALVNWMTVQGVSDKKFMNKLSELYEVGHSTEDGLKLKA